jgi:Lrp/AsnC family leucine-responsive transcriptional regulator
MKDIQPKLIRLFKEGYCTPQIARIAREIDEPSATIHYNIKKLEKAGAIKTYKAVFDYKQINESFCAFVLIALSSAEYGAPEEIAGHLARHNEVESVDILAGEWELLLKIRTKDQDEYFEFLTRVLSKEKGINKTSSIVSLKQIKTEFVRL